MLRAALGLAIAALLLGAACTTQPVPTPPSGASTPNAAPTSSAGSSTSTAPAPTALAPTGTPRSPLGPLVAGSFALAPAFGGRVFDRPVELVPYPDGSFLLADQSGLVTQLAADGRQLGMFLDQRAVTLRSGNEEGLLDVALDPAFASNRYVYVYASRGNPRRTMLARYVVSPADTVDPSSELIILEAAQPFPNHNGGSIRFGPDGLLYLGLGDGGSSGDPGNRAQNLQELLGKIIRLDVRAATREQPYRPAGDPALLARGARPEVWAYGLRNPWRMVFDPVTGGLFVGDVGQDRFEEVDRVVAGANHGWPALEGVTCYRPASNCIREGTVAPLAVYSHADGCSVTGGEVVDGWYLYADFCSGRLWGVPIEGGSAVLLADTDLRIAAFARDREGNMYVLAHGGAINRLVRVK
ncbi:MAG: PQQ-dependent sugar dehydrogenase [Dehalococcoidia bacterium]